MARGSKLILGNRNFMRWLSIALPIVSVLILKHVGFEPMTHAKWVCTFKPLHYLLICKEILLTFCYTLNRVCCAVDFIFQREAEIIEDLPVPIESFQVSLHHMTHFCTKHICYSPWTESIIFWRSLLIHLSRSSLSASLPPRSLMKKMRFETSSK